MKKKLLSLFAVAFLSFALAACATPKDGGDTDEPDQGDVVTNTYTVIFEVNGTRYQTERVKEGEKITSTVNNPVAPDGQRFVGWFVGDTQIDLETYVVTGNVTIVAKFEAVETTVTLSVDDVKEDGKTYYLVLGWWECTDVNSDGTPKLTSNLTKTDVRLIYSNIINYLKLSGVSETDINNIQFRNENNLKKNLDNII